MEIDLVGENIEIGRNDEWVFYKNRLTSSATEWARDKWKLKNIAALYVEEKKVYGKFAENLFDVQPDTQDRAFILVNTDTNQPIYETHSYESLLYHIDFIGIAKAHGKKIH
jgi:hypothetical protein